MKKILSASPVILCILYAFLPVCKLLGFIFGYNFVFNSYPISIIILSSINIIVLELLFSLKISLNNVQTKFSTFVMPLSAINGLVYIFESNWKATILFVLICCGCSIILFVKFTHPIKIKIITVFLSAILLILLLFCSFVDFIFENFGANTVVKSVASPQNTYTAVVIDSDQGALGGDTLVDVYYNGKSINLIFCKFSKSPIRVYTGGWGEFEQMQISWENEYTLIINGKKYYVDYIN